MSHREFSLKKGALFFLTPGGVDVLTLPTVIPITTMFLSQNPGQGGLHRGLCSPFRRWGIARGREKKTSRLTECQKKVVSLHENQRDWNFHTVRNVLPGQLSSTETEDATILFHLFLPLNTTLGLGGCMGVVSLHHGLGWG